MFKVLNGGTPSSLLIGKGNSWAVEVTLTSLATTSTPPYLDFGSSLTVPIISTTDSGDIDPLCSGCEKKIRGLYYYFSDPGLFRVCLKVTVGDTVLLIDCCAFLVFSHGAYLELILQDLSELI